MLAFDYQLGVDLPVFIGVAVAYPERNDIAFLVSGRGVIDHAFDIAQFGAQAGRQIDGVIGRHLH